MVISLGAWRRPKTKTGCAFVRRRRRQSHFHATFSHSPGARVMSSSPINPSDFTTKIDNPFMILRPGTTFVYSDRGENSTDTITVTSKTHVIDGVACVVVHD